jgi:hypothetical protein
MITQLRVAERVQATARVEHEEHEEHEEELSRCDSSSASESAVMCLTSFTFWIDPLRLAVGCKLGHVLNMRYMRYMRKNGEVENYLLHLRLRSCVSRSSRSGLTR